jgi:hypothetical protein
MAPKPPRPNESFSVALRQARNNTSCTHEERASRKATCNVSSSACVLIRLVALQSGLEFPLRSDGIMFPY